MSLARYTRSLAVLLLFLSLLIGSRAHAQAASSGEADRLFTASKFAQARDAYLAALRDDPNSVALRLGLIRTLMRLDRWQEELTTARTAVDQAPQSADAHGMLSLALMRAGLPDQAALQAKQALALDPESYWALIGAGRTASWENRTQEALNELRHATQLHPDWPEAWYYLIDADESNEITQSDLDDLTAYMRLNPKGHPNDLAMEVLPSRLPVLRTFLNDPPFHAEQPYTEAQMIAAEQGSGDVISFTTPIERSNGYIILPIRVNGTKLRVLFDTGGGSDLTLTQQAADRLKLPQLSQSKVFGVSGKEPARLYRADSLQIGSETFGAIPIESIGTNVGAFDGIMGVNVFDHYVITVDFAHNTMTLARGKSAASPAATSGNHLVTTPFHYLDGDILTSVSVDGHAVWALVDTGADDYALLSMRLAREIAGGRAKGSYHESFVNGQMGIGTTQTRQTVLLFNSSVPLHIDNMSGPVFNVNINPAFGVSLLDSQISPASEFELGSLLGISFLITAQRVTFDYPHRLLTLEVSGTTPVKAGK